VNVYADSSVLLRVVFRSPGVLPAWQHIERPIASDLIRLECLRTIDRARLQYRLSDETVSERRAMIGEQLDAFETIPVDRAVLERAAEPFPTLIGSLGAIHLASALLVRPQVEDLQFATHDRELGTAARAMGFRVLGIPPKAPRRRPQGAALDRH
jgi:predicted nucleic acid-binding protein